MERRLAAILAADVVGYSRLMGADEAGTVAALRALRADLFDPMIARHRGRTVKLMGDGTLVEFASVVDALTCAIAVQDALTARNAALPQDKQIELRIGINLGDVIVEDDDLYGDGVNIAARLEGLADHGGICVSAKVFEEARGRVDARFEDLGNRPLKNIAEPVHVYRVVRGGSAPARGAADEDTTDLRRPVLLAAIVILVVFSLGTLWWAWGHLGTGRAGLPLPDRPSIAVLPFQDLSQEPRKWFGDGMAEDIITDLSKLKGLFVIARNSSFQYRGGNQDLRKVGKELGVAFLLEGSVRRANGKLRINAQLIDARTGGHVWAERFDGRAGDVFALQDRVTKQVVDSMALVLTDAEKGSITGPATDVPEAHDAYLQALAYLNQQTPEAFSKAKDWFRKALQLDPHYADALAGRAYMYDYAFSSGWLDETTKWDRKWATAALEKSMEHPTALSYAISARMRLNKPDRAGAKADVEKGLALDPNQPDLHIVAGFIASGEGDHVAAEASVRLAMRLNPRYPASYLGDLAAVLLLAGRNEEAVDLLSRNLERNPDDWPAYVGRGLALSELGRLEAAQQDFAAAKEKWPETWGTQFLAGTVSWLWGRMFGDHVVARYKKALAAAGVPEFPGGFDIKPENRLDGEVVAKTYGNGAKTEGICCGGKWHHLWLDDGVRRDFFNGRQFRSARFSFSEDGSYRLRHDSPYEPDRICTIYRNPNGSNKAMDAYYYVCPNGVYPHGIFPLPQD